MRILMANKFLYPRAGAETYMLTVADGLQRKGHTVGFFGMAHPLNSNLGSMREIQNIEFGQHQRYSERFTNLVSAAWQRTSGHAESELLSFVEDFRPDVIHAHNIYNQISPGIFRRLRGKVPVLMTVHDYKIICPNYSLFVDGKTCTQCIGGNYYHCVTKRCCQKKLLPSLLASLSAYQTRFSGTYERDYSRFICPSQFMAERLKSDGVHKSKLAVLHNFAPSQKAPSPVGSSLFYAGRLSKEKGLDTLLNAYVSLPKPRWPLRIAGTGPYEAELKERAAMLGITDVQWLGRIEPSEVSQELQAAAFSIVPSLWFENCSIAILESLAMGTPVVTSSMGGNPELVRDAVDGIVFEAGNATQLYERLHYYQQHPGKLDDLGAKAFERAREKFSEEEHLARLEQHYAELCHD